MDAGERKKKSSRLRRRMRRVLALLSRPMRRRAARHVTDGSRQMLVSNEQQQQQPEIEFELDTVTSAPEVVVSPAPSDRQAKMTILVKLRKSFRRRNLKTNRAKPDIEDTTSLPTSTSGLFEAEQDRLIELVDEPTEVETRVDDNIATTILSPGEPEVDQIVRHSSEDTTERQVEPEADDVTKQFDDVTRGYDGGKKKHRKRKRAKRYAKRVCICTVETFNCGCYFLFHFIARHFIGRAVVHASSTVINRN